MISGRLLGVRALHGAQKSCVRATLPLGGASIVGVLFPALVTPLSPRAGYLYETHHYILYARSCGSDCGHTGPQKLLPTPLAFALASHGSPRSPFRELYLMSYTGFNPYLQGSERLKAVSDSKHNSEHFLRLVVHAPLCAFNCSSCLLCVLPTQLYGSA